MLDSVYAHVQHRMRFHYDGAPSHYARYVQDNLDWTLKQLDCAGRFLPLALRSPDLFRLDYFLWDTMKNIEYSVSVNSEMDLVARI